MERSSVLKTIRDNKFKVFFISQTSNYWGSKGISTIRTQSPSIGNTNDVSIYHPIKCNDGLLKPADLLSQSKQNGGGRREGSRYAGLSCSKIIARCNSF